jgi:hypothetical protein
MRTASSARLLRAAAAGAAALALLLAGCGGEPSGAEYSGPGARPRLIVSETAPGPAKPEGEAGAGTAALAPGQPARPEPEIDADPRRLMGLDESGLTALLGSPEFRRSDPPAEQWRYRGEGCMLDLFLYGPARAAATDKRITVRHAEARPIGDGRVSAGDCLRVLLRARLLREQG